MLPLVAKTQREHIQIFGVSPTGTAGNLGVTNAPVYCVPPRRHRKRTVT